MLFKMTHLAGIHTGKISLAFRKWKKPTVKEGSHIKTAIGVVAVTAMEKFTLKNITPALAMQAGFDTLDDLLAELNKVRDGTLYKISVRYAGADPRIALRNKTSVTADELEKIKQKLAKLDALSKEGPWTAKVLNAIKENPELRAVDLAKLSGYEKDWLKINIRKLKNLGLTISHEVGYSLSPLGKRLL